jgi:hypothetical protein
MINDDIDTIIAHLYRLTLQQQQLTEQIAELQTEIQGRRQNLAQSDNSDTLEEKPLVNRAPEGKTRKTTIKKGDRVRVKNPGKNQPNTGTIDSYTPSRLFVRIKLDNCGEIINRAPKNVIRIE